MNHEDSFDRMDDYLEGRLSPEDERAYEAAVAADSTLLEAVEGARAIRREARALRRRIEPERDLWRGIEDAIRPERSGVDFGRYRNRHTRRPVVGYALATAAILAMVVGVPVLMQRSTEPSQGAIPPVGMERDPDPAITAVRAHYASARGELREVLASRRDALSPGTLATIEENLEIITGAVEEIESALATDPGSERLERMLHAAYQSEVGLLRQAVGLTGDVAGVEGDGDEA